MEDRLKLKPHDYVADSRRKEEQPRGHRERTRGEEGQLDNNKVEKKNKGSEELMRKGNSSVKEKAGLHDLSAADGVDVHKGIDRRESLKGVVKQDGVKGVVQNDATKKEETVREKMVIGKGGGDGKGKKGEKAPSHEPIRKEEVKGNGGAGGAYEEEEAKEGGEGRMSPEKMAEALRSGAMVIVYVCL